MMELASRRSLDTLQLGRGFAALAVVCHHTTRTLAQPKYLDEKIFSIFNAGDSGVMYFFVLSGFVIFLAHANDFGDGEKAIHFAWRRFQRIYPTLWVALICVIPLILLMKAELSFYDVFSSFMLLPIEHEPIIDTVWTLRHEIIFYAIFALAICNPRIGWLVGTLWLGLSLVQPLIFPTYPLSFVFHPAHVLFGLGILACWLFNRGYVEFPKLILMLGIVIFGGTWIAVAYGVLLKNEASTLCYGIGAMLMILGGVVLETKTGLRIPRVLVFLGEASYSIYLIHFPALSGFAKAVTKMKALGIPNEMLFLMVASGGVAVGVAFYLLVEKPLLTFSRTIGRVPKRVEA
jgi:exopolysaccharide production protein ExoZ